jgi:hypothetical protein
VHLLGNKPRSLNNLSGKGDVNALKPLIVGRYFLAGYNPHFINIKFFGGCVNEPFAPAGRVLCFQANAGGPRFRTGFLLFLMKSVL